MFIIKPFEYDENFDNYEPHTRIFENCDDLSDSEDDIEENNDICITNTSDETLDSIDDVSSSLFALCYGDLYVIGKVWIETLKTVLVGAQLRLVPVVHAAKPPPPPTRPPKMKYTDLPIYNNPHYDYKEYERKKEVCPEASTKLLQKYLLPKVKCLRKETQKGICCVRSCAKDACKDVCSNINAKKQDLKKYMRDPNNLLLRQGIVASGTCIGLLAGANIPKKLFLASIGGLSTGALCFPKETDELFRNFMYTTGKTAVTVYNSVFGNNFNMRDKVPCTDDVPKEPPKRKEQCPKKKGRFW